MYEPLFQEFLVSNDTLRVFKDSQLIYSSDKERLLPLLDYIETLASRFQQVVIMDRIMGNAAALLCVKADSIAVYSPLGSCLADETLKSHGITCQLTKTVPYIQNISGTGMCPMEELSIGKRPNEFYEVLKTKVESK
jgi:hypothetical protein